MWLKMKHIFLCEVSLITILNQFVISKAIWGVIIKFLLSCTDFRPQGRWEGYLLRQRFLRQ